MLTLEYRIKPFTCLGERLLKYCYDESVGFSEWDALVKSQSIYNPWYVEPFVLKALNLWSERLSSGSLLEFVAKYPRLLDKRPEKHVAVIPEMNVPLAGLHDLMMVLLAGHHFYARNINHEHDLLQFVTNQLILIEPELERFIHWGAFPKQMDSYLVHSKPENDGAFSTYFEKKGNLIRRNNISIGVVSLTDPFEDIKLLGDDIFTFFGLSRYCVRKIFIPKEFPVHQFFEPIESFSFLYQYNRYANNYDYHKSVFMMDRIPFYDNGFMILRESSELHVPIGCLYFEYYDSLDDVHKKIKLMETYVQKIVTNVPEFRNAVKPGTAHKFHLWEYEDHKDTLQFLLES